MPTSIQSSAPLAVRRDLGAVRTVLQRIKEDEQLAPLDLFGRRCPERMLDYLDRRSRDRSSTQMPIYLQVVDYDGRNIKPIEEGQPEFLAFTKDVSLRGIGFSHDESFDAEYAAVSFDLLNGESVSLLLDVRWSNVDRGFQYLSGGRFVGIIDGD